MPLRIVQLTDCHLFADRQQTLRGICTWPRFIQALAQVRKFVVAPELVVFSGDTAHDESLATYRQVRQELGDLTAKTRMLPGNHDDRTSLREVFSLDGGPAERITFVHRGSDWQVIGLDSQRPGELPGALGEEQLRWLDRQLSAENRPTLLFLHHPPVPVASAWLDKIGLLDASDLSAVLARHSHVRLVACGHVHQQLTASLGDAVVVCTPAVGPAFRPRTEQLEIDDLPPALRLFELYRGGRWSTQVLACAG